METMDDMISRKQAIEAIRSCCKGCNNYDGVRCRACSFDDAIRTVEDAPAIDAQHITGDTSDGYHTFNELYHHRAVLFSVIVNALPDRAWKSRKHHDGSMYDGMFIVGVDTPDGQATYHYDIEPYWDIFDCRELERAPEWDGHTPAQAIERISRLQLLKHGQWLDGGECSQCHEFDNRDPYGSNYCPNCGARMDGDEYAAD